MCKPILLLAIICFSFISLTVSGCIGFVTYLPNECTNENPKTYIRESDNRIATKADFLNAWGKPDKINVASKNTETWIYERHLWCGVIPIVLIGVPLLLPVCHGFERIEFEGDQAKRLHIRRIVVNGYVAGVTLGGALVKWVESPACRYPLSEKGADNDKAKPATRPPP